jgi:hypothetical protein
MQIGGDASAFLISAKAECRDAPCSADPAEQHLIVP